MVEFVNMILYRLEKDNLVELVWENGQLLFQGQSSRNRQTSICGSSLSHCLTSHAGETRDKDLGNDGNITIGDKFGTVGPVQPVSNDIPMLSLPSDNGGLNQDEGMVPWLNYAAARSFPSDCSELFPEFSGLTGNELASQIKSAAFSKRSVVSHRLNKGSNGVPNNASLEEQTDNLKTYPGGVTEVGRHKNVASKLCLASSQHCQISSSNSMSRFSNDEGDGTRNTSHSSGLKMQQQDTKRPSNGFMNFSHFSRPAAIIKANLQSAGLIPGSEFSNNKQMETKDMIATNNNHVEPTLNDSICGLKKETSSHSQPAAAVPSKTDKISQEANPPEEPSVREPPRLTSEEGAFRNHNLSNPTLNESTSKRLLDCEKSVVPIVISSSVCSANSLERTSDDPVDNLKRKHQDAEDNECSEVSDDTD